MPNPDLLQRVLRDVFKAPRLPVKFQARPCHLSCDAASADATRLAGAAVAFPCGTSMYGIHMHAAGLHLPAMTHQALHAANAVPEGLAGRKHAAVRHSSGLSSPCAAYLQSRSPGAVPAPFLRTLAELRSQKIS